MKSLMLFVSVFMVSSFAAADDVKPTVMDGNLQYFLCSDGPKIDVYAEDLRKVFFEADSLESVLPVQNFRGATQKIKLEHGVEKVYVAVQFPNADEDEENTGWVEKRFVRSGSECSVPLKQASPSDVTSTGQSPTTSILPTLPTLPVDPIVPPTLPGFSGSDFVFPLTERPTVSYLEGMRQFGWNRPHHRLHAACDLYRPLRDKVVSIAPGTVVAGPIAFYQGTYEIEVVHPGGIIARYGEVLGKRADGIRSGARVKPGQTLGYVGKTTVKYPMLHFELYSGKLRGPLTVRKNKGFQRRKDLVNPTKYLESWEAKSFGESY